MNVFVLDSNNILWQTVRDYLLSDLSSSGHQVLIKENPYGLLHQVQESLQPSVILVGPKLHNICPFEWCKKVRATEMLTRPFIITALGDDKAHTIIEAFNAGADDYLSEPWQPDILKAKIHAAIRTLLHQEKLIDLIRQRENLLNNLISQIGGELEKNLYSVSLHHPAEKTTSEKKEDIPGYNAESQSAGLQSIETILRRDQIESFVRNTLYSIGGAKSEAIISNDPVEVAYSLIHFLIIPEKNLWLDLLLEADTKSCKMLFEALFKTSANNASDSDLLNALSETLNMIQESIKAHIKELNCDVFSPFVPQTIDTQNIPAWILARSFSRQTYSLNEIRLRFTLLANSRKVVLKPLKYIQHGDVLVESLKTDNSSDLVIIKKGTLLVGKYLEKASTLAELAPPTLKQPVIEPSPFVYVINKKK
ncbi:MAG: response regulator transcription factor [Verrucomicrobiia bacterium]